MPQERPAVTAHEFAISSGHELASEAGFEILEAGGNLVPFHRYDYEPWVTEIQLMRVDDVARVRTGLTEIP